MQYKLRTILSQVLQRFKQVDVCEIIDTENINTKLLYENLKDINTGSARNIVAAIINLVYHKLDGKLYYGTYR